MKYILIFISFCFISNLTAQNEPIDNQEMINVFKSAHASTNASFGTSVYLVNPKRKIEGTVYLFDKWENSGVIYANNNQKYAINNINLNIKRNTFESKIGQDSLYAFSFNNIDKFVINNRVFKNYYWDNDNRVYEIIAEGRNFQILKGFNVTYVEGAANPMLNRSNDKYIRSEKYYVQKDDKIIFLSLRKPRILKLLNLNNKQEENLLNYIENRKLSFKDEVDLKSIIEFANKELLKN